MERRLFLGGLSLVPTIFSGRLGWAQQRRFFRIGTGGITGTYYPIGGMIANVVSNPPGSRPCERGGDCGVPGLVVLAQTSLGSVANIRAIVDQRLESGFAQSDITYGAFTGTGVFDGEAPASELRLIANLYAESMHLVVSKDSGIQSMADLKGKRISLDEVGSGTLVDALLLLDAYGLSPDDLDAVHVKPGPAISMMEAGELDGMFVIAGYPASSVHELIRTQGARLVPIDGEAADQLLETQRFFTGGTIPAAVYGLPEDVPTLNVGAQWLTSLSEDDELIYQITSVLWSEQAHAKFQTGHPKARSISIETALEGAAIPIHRGAARYYKERGLLQN